jgi:predicted RNA-binding protein with TRAM domain
MEEEGFGGHRGGGFRRGGSRGGGFSPVKVGEELDVTIEAVGEKGDGIAKKKGFVLFVPGVKQGDTVRIRITKVFKKMGFAEVLGPATGQPETSAPKEESQEGEPETQEEEEQAEDSEEF